MAIPHIMPLGFVDGTSRDGVVILLTNPQESKDIREGTPVTIWKYNPGTLSTGRIRGEINAVGYVSAIITMTDQGTAFWWIGASILFAAIIESWNSDRNPLILVAGIVGASFGLMAPTFILADQNPPLLALLIVGAFYSVIFGLIAVVIAKLVYRPITKRIRPFLASRLQSTTRDNNVNPNSK